MPEIVVHGKTGMVVDEPSELARAIGASDCIDRRACRRHAESHFDTATMATAYEAVYRTVVEGRELRTDARSDDPSLISA